MTDEIELTKVLAAAGEGNREAAEDAYVIVYEELKRLARSRIRKSADHSLTPTALVNEAYMKLLGGDESSWSGRQHFFRTAAKAMRHILIDRARHRSRDKRGQGAKAVTLDMDPQSDDSSPESLLALDEALKSLEKIEPRSAQVVNLRYFAGLTIEETAQALQVATATVERDWQFARAWLYRELNLDAED